ncbi:MAG TPA: pseudouridine synthase [Phototrophicaceae bacterium]|nr:pseudouridine synthase [Phototrophicaceae bacterium]
MKERVQKLMAQAGIASRRDCEKFIEQGRVKVNGKVIHLGDQADPTADIIEVDGQKLSFAAQHTYIALNKPKNVLSTDDPHKDDTRKTVYDFIPFEGRLFTVGRLDADSEGLVVLTDDGDLANRLTHPRYRHSKTYKVVVQGIPSAEAIQRWQQGIFITDDDTGETYKTAPCSVEIVKGGLETSLRVIMAEGKKRQIRRIANVLGHPVKSLLRTHIGRLALGELRSGEWRELTPADVQALKQSAPELRTTIPAKTAPGRDAKPATSGSFPRKPESKKPGSRRPSQQTERRPRNPTSRRKG